MSEVNKPAAKINLSYVSAIIWRNQTPKGFAYSVTFERSYKDEGGNFKSATSFNIQELLLVAKVADLAHSEIFKLRAEDRNSDRSDDQSE